MSKSSPTVERAREVLSRKLGSVVSTEGAREAVENLVGLFQLLREWDDRAKASAGLKPVPCAAYPSAASGPRRAAR